MANPQTGDLIWTRSEGVVGSLIRFGARVKYHGWRTALWRACQTVILRRGLPEDPTDFAWGNHIAVYVDGWFVGLPGGDYVIEALAHGLTLTPLEHYKPTQYRLLPLIDVRPDLGPFDRLALEEFAKRELADHDSYGWLAIASIVLQLLTPVKLDVSWDGSMICSAFGARCWEHAGVTIPTLSPYTTMPADLAMLALSSKRPDARPPSKV